MTTDTEYLWERRHRALHRVELSVLYHRKRERFFDLCDKAAKAVAIIGGSAAFARAGGDDAVRIAAALITVTSTIALVGSLAERSRRHADLARSFGELESAMLAKGERDYTEDDLNAWDAKVRALEAAEPAALSALVRICQNEIAIAQGQPDRVTKLPLRQRWLAHFVDFAPPQSV